MIIVMQPLLLCVCVCVGMPASQPFLASGCRRCVTAAWRMCLCGSERERLHTVHVHCNTHKHTVCMYTHSLTCWIRHRCSRYFIDSVTNLIMSSKRALEIFMKTIKYMKKNKSFFAPYSVYHHSKVFIYIVQSQWWMQLITFT